MLSFRLEVPSLNISSLMNSQLHSFVVNASELTKNSELLTHTTLGYNESSNNMSGSSRR
jgi:hypothetical protein